MPQYLKNTKTGRIFIRTPELANHVDMQPCDAPKSARANKAPAPSVQQEPNDPAPTGGDDLDNMDKEQLEKLARERFDVELDRRKSVATLREQVRELVENEA
jgi:hypothetical protein